MNKQQVLDKLVELEKKCSVAEADAKCVKCGASGVALARPREASDWMCLKCDAEFRGTVVDYWPENDREPE